VNINTKKREGDDDGHEAEEEANEAVIFTSMIVLPLFHKCMGNLTKGLCVRKGPINVAD
jgi:hypothetical protein